MRQYRTVYKDEKDADGKVVRTTTEYAYRDISPGQAFATEDNSVYVVNKVTGAIKRVDESGMKGLTKKQRRVKRRAAKAAKIAKDKELTAMEQVAMNVAGTGAVSE